MKTTIQVTEEVRSKLVKLKYSLNCQDYNEVLERVLTLIQRFKLAGELKWNDTLKSGEGG